MGAATTIVIAGTASVGRKVFSFILKVSLGQSI